MFDTPINRRATGSYKWDETREGVIPMWVADMDFAVAPCIQHAIAERAAHPIYGYVCVPDTYYDTLVRWYKMRHQWSIDASTVLYTTGVVPAVSAILQAVIQPGEKVIVQTPAYNCFFSSIRNAGAQMVSNALLRVPVSDEDGCATFSYRINLEELERQCADEAARVLILCNPHNPSGRLWTKEELLAVADICRRHDVLVIADEIHNELAAPGTSYTPWGTLGSEWQENAVICISASKSFNIAGLQMANIVVSNPELRRRINKRININETCDVGPFGYVAAMAAFSDEGAQWLDALRSYIWENYHSLCRLLVSSGHRLPVARLEATYLAWVDVSHFCDDATDFAAVLERDYGLKVSPGEIYGADGEERFLRFNLACPRSVLHEGLRRFLKAIDRKNLAS